MKFCCQLKIAKTLLGFLLCFVTSAQISNPLEQIIPPSPIAREFDKYIKYDVSLHNGLPEISIPLYEIKVQGLTIPISLSYHASGIKYKQNSGEVGLGWSLNPHYRISKTIYGRDDDNSTMPTPITDPVTMGLEKQKSGYLVNFINYETTSGFPSASQSYDGEFDLYTYTLQNSGGTFIEKNRQTREYEFLDSRGKKLTRVSTGSGYYFNLVDGNGLKYKMGNGAPMEQHGDGGFNAISAVGWSATEITTPFNETVFFDYVSRIVHDDQSQLANASIQDGMMINYERCFPTVTGNSTTPYSTYTSSFLKTITTGQEKVEFFRDQTGYLLRKIEIRDLNNVLKKRIEFTYSQNLGYTFLNKVEVFASDNPSPQVYILEYYPQNGLTSDMTFDNWGYHYYTNVSPINNDFILPEVQNDQFENRQSYNCPDPPPIITASSLLSNFAFSKKLISLPPTDFSLKRITYPTGGFTEYEYESNQYLNSTTQVGGGLRIKRISSDDAVKGTTLIKEFKYGHTENGKGYAKINFGPWDFVKEGIWSVRYTEGQNQYDYRGIDKQFIYSTLPTNEAVSDASGAVYYPEVNEYLKDQNGTVLGKTQHLFEVSNYWYNVYDQFQTNTSYQTKDLIFVGPTPRTYFPRYIKNQAPWVKPYLTESNYYGFYNNSFNLLKKVKLEYNETIRNTFSGLKVRQFLLSADAGYSDEDQWGNSPYEGLIESLFDFANYSVISGVNLPVRKTTTEYTASGNIVTELNFQYNENDQVIKEEATNSKAGSIITEYKYPMDFKAITASDGVTQGVKKLQELNIIAPVIEKSVWQKNSSGIKSLVNAQITTFSTTSPVQHKILQIENSTPLSDFLPSSVQGGAIVYDSRYKEKFVFDNYDSKGNLLQQHKASDINHSYFWGYKNQYPIAEAINAKWGEIYYAPFEEQVGWTGAHWQYGDVAIAYDNARNITGRTAAKIEKSTAGEKYCHADYWLQIDNTTPTKYKVSGWVYSTGPAVDIYLFMKTAAETGYFTQVDYVNTNVTNQWVYVEKVFEVPATIKKLNIRLDNNGGGTVWFDDIRVHPEKARMTTYTYEPLVGMSSQTDVNNRRTHYTYDVFGRLSLVLDHDKNILKKYCYNYQGQAEDCGVPTWTSTKSGTFTKQCADGGIGTSHTYTYTATSTTSQANADQLAQLNVNVNGQNYVNSIGTCTWYNSAISDNYYSQNCLSGQTPNPYYVSVPANTYSSTVSKAAANALAVQYAQSQANQYGTCQSSLVQLTYSDNTYSYGWVIELRDVSSSQTYTFYLSGGGSGLLGQVPAGIYDISIYNQYGTYNWYWFTAGCYNYTSGQVANFYYVDINQGCSDITINY